MAARLHSELTVGALLRRVNDAGGIGMVLAKGDRHDGAILLITYDRGVFSGIYQREIGGSGRPSLNRIGPADGEDGDEVRQFWQRRRRVDPDLWVVELDIASAKRLAAETLLAD